MKYTVKTMKTDDKEFDLPDEAQLVEVEPIKRKRIPFGAKVPTGEYRVEYLVPEEDDES